MKGQTQWVTKGDTNNKKSADSNKHNKESKIYVLLTVHPCIIW
jgi:hypothetical protein